MKKTYIIVTIVMLVYGLCIPLICLRTGGESTRPGVTENSSAQQLVKSTEKVRVLDKETGKITKMDAREYIFGVVAAEMPASYGEEALKAQVVASYTYMLFRANERADLDYDIVADSAKDQAFITRKQACERWGDEADKYCDKIDKVINSVWGYVMVDDKDMPILAAYHNISSGRTESAKTIWGSDYSYLQPVESVGDLTASKYLSENSFTADELAEKLGLPETEKSPSGWVSGIKTSDSGTVTSINVCGKQFTGAKIRSALGLRSCVFTVGYSDGKFNFRVQGHGHGVGMSQFGANYLARQNYTYVEILSWYYTGCKMKLL